MAKEETTNVSSKLTDEYVLKYVLACRDESEQAKQDRMRLNDANYDAFHLRHDFSHKQEGQSREILAKVRNATEQITSMFQQSLADLDDWWNISTLEGAPGGDLLPIRPEEAKRLMNFMLKRADYFSHVGSSVQSGVLGSLAASKVHGTLIPKPRFTVERNGKRGKEAAKRVIVQDDKTWELRFDDLRQRDCFPDPTGANSYFIEDCIVDLSQVRRLTEGPLAIYKKGAVEQLQPWGTTDLSDGEKSRETGQNVVHDGMRPRVKLTEFWGDIIDSTNGKILAENVVVTIANDSTVIRGPADNPLWHQKFPIIAAPLIPIKGSVWGIALMDAGTKHSHALTEFLNLILDSALKSVWGVNQVRVDVLEDPSQLAGGIKWGTNLKVNSALPPGVKAMEPVLTGEIPTAAINIFNLLMQETLTSMMTNDLRMGAQSSRAVKATEVVAAENTITNIFQGIGKKFEEKKIQPELELAWATIAQNWDLIDEEIFKSLFGAERGAELAAMDPEDVFVNTIGSMKFEVYGISLALSRQADFRKWTTLLQVVGGSEVLLEAFTEEFSFSKLLGEVITAIDIDKSKIKNEDPPAAAGGGDPLAAITGAPNGMSQTPAAADTGPGGAQGNILSALIGNQMNAPSSQAIR